MRSCIRLRFCSLCVQVSAQAQDRQTEPPPAATQTGRDEAGPDTASEAPAAPPGPDDPAPQFDEEVVVVGSRARPRSVTDSTVPIDVIPATGLVRGDFNLANQLRVLLPSFQVNPQEDGDLGAVVRPASLRGLAPDHTLVLVNGKRRHRSSIVDWHGGNGVAFGSQGPDISAIPAIALRQVEVLRDGAAAQYGSDAIAGVMNFQLEDARSGGSVELNTGMYRAGDGESAQFAGNVGLPLGATGFANLSLEYGNESTGTARNPWIH